MRDEFDKNFYEGFNPEEAGDDWDGTEEECRFVNLMEKIKASKVKFSCYYATYDSGLSHIYWTLDFKEHSICDGENAHPKLLGCIKEYLVWSSQYIEELET